jgi:hypothetical protein
MRVKNICHVIFILFLVAAALYGQSFDPIDGLAGFARLYGVVRYFHPADAAQEIDWNEFVTYGVQELQKVKTREEYETALLKLFKPITNGIWIGAASKRNVTTEETAGSTKMLVAWQHDGPGIHRSSGDEVYLSQRTNRKRKIPVSGFATMMQSVDAKLFRGSRVRLAGYSRKEIGSDKTQAAFWVRVDRADGSMGFFDNMNDRPIQEKQWREYVIEGPVAEDAERIAFGFMIMGGEIAAGFDDIRLSVLRNEKWEPVTIVNGEFESQNGWKKAGTLPEIVNAKITEGGAVQGKFWMNLSLPKEILSDPIESIAPKPGVNTRVQLTEGLAAIVPTVLDDESAKITREQTQALVELKKNLERISSSVAVPSQSIADVVVTWAALRHFYPYWDVVKVDWNERLFPYLKSAVSKDETPEAHLNLMRRLLVEIKDGHAGVYSSKIALGSLPIAVRIIENEFIVVASKSDKIKTGDVISMINGVPAMQWFLQKRELVSGSEQWRDRTTLSFYLERGTRNSTITLNIEQDDGESKNVELSYTEQTPARIIRPETVSQLKPGIWYIDLTRANPDIINERLSDLTNAKGVVFDVRGYPTDAAMTLLPHLIDNAEKDRWMHVPLFVAPGGNALEWDSVGWDLEPKKPLITSNRVFITNSEAISYAESVMGYIKDRKLGYIIGSSTAGTNGNVVRIDLPSGLIAMFTGMRVTRHDGTSRFHLIGIQPDQNVEPTISGVRTGQDTLLDAAVNRLQAK